MKKLISLSLTATILGILFFSSCAKEDPVTPDDPAATDPRTKFLGHWDVTETGQIAGSSTYSCDITDSSNASYVLIGCLYGYNKKTYATVSGNNLTHIAIFKVGFVAIREV